MIDNFLVCDRLVIPRDPVFSRYDGLCSCPCAVFYSIVWFTRGPGWNILFPDQHGVSEVRQRMSMFHYVHRARGWLFESFRGNFISIGSTFPSRQNVSINYYSKKMKHGDCHISMFLLTGIAISNFNIYIFVYLLNFFYNIMVSLFIWVKILITKLFSVV